MKSRRRFVFPKNPVQGCGGFTVVELLAVVVTVAMLAAVLLPALAGTKSDPRAFQCLNNQRQLILAWQMYAADNNGLLPPNDYPFSISWLLSSAATRSQMNNWAAGTMTTLDAYSLAPLTSTNTVLSTYISNPKIYHCPADNYITSNSGGKTHVR